jgi:hypothetical protein
MKSNRRIGMLVGGLAVTALVGSATAATVFASSPAPIDASNDHVTCTEFFGAFKFNPPLGGPAAPSMTASVKGTIDGCTDADNANVKLAASKISGTITYGSNSALALAGVANVTGSLTVSWKTASGAAKLTGASSTINFSQINSGTASPGGNFTDTYGLFQLGHDGAHGNTATPSVTGAFTGGNAGATTSFDALSSQSVTAILGPSGLGSGKGIKVANIGIGQITVG